MGVLCLDYDFNVLALGEEAGFKISFICDLSTLGLRLIVIRNQNFGFLA